jgi:tRNA(Ile)-lysidine synthase
VPAAERIAPVSAAETAALFADLAAAPALLLAVSGGPDSTCLMLLVARWRATLARGPSLVAATVDHALRAESAAEARAVGALAARLGIPHRILHWTGDKPRSGLPEAARMARYRLLAAAARSAGAAHILTGHTIDDQAETVLLRMARGSGLTGLGAMARAAPLEHFPEKWSPVFRQKMRPLKKTRVLSGSVEPESTLEEVARHDRAAQARSARRRQPLLIVRPLLDLPKARLLATLDAAGLAAADDPSNRDPRFTRARMRQLMPMLAEEGLSARRLAVLARRLRRADAAIESVVDAAERAEPAWQQGDSIRLDVEKFTRLPAEVAIRLLARAIARIAGDEPARLGRLESLYEALADAALEHFPESMPSRRREWSPVFRKKMRPLNKAGAPSGSLEPESIPARGLRVRRTLAGALVTLAGGTLTIERAPPRRKPRASRGQTLTTRIYGVRSTPDPR